ncbi:MAG TPA: hypothetical protein PKW18_09080 [Candidatus Sumerlaeota bacterium]|nr:MAG: hypothetical protein BWY12_00529 [candidate division BRC1 bacterium ADurb.Bin183]HOE63139.1 hypothetical protein [Candidatus Sumerlaeota bacterium]HRR31146.1 hypothetical protein [Candidatus Sumerlaeia bacterium]HON51546.1 hypothetical protein [Candidatus Sumerlaeota bacterium]HOR65272.1 hypothetical protein [Candidatus Sumerlaeota bacterium]
MIRKQKHFVYIIISTGVFVILILAAVVIASKKKPLSPERKVGRRFEEAVRALVDKNFPAMDEILAADYAGSIGKNSAEALDIAHQFLDNAEGLHVRLLDLHVASNGDGSYSVASNFEYTGYYTGSGVYNRIPLSGGLPGYSPGEVKALFIFEEERPRLIRIELTLEGRKF